ncbi:hypothetical protein BS50DRAFT_399191 [Corynespora cassiicola Philippines]|uniref:Uncharacterized protein n=1 Tax=Corynespora cassiicola Philippines TaxID=1448308 RepID=A0A2T2NK90_CORCC|nr:hypothetical protein BS50DRAFT_399191 [Corynespora cassiicola Philippines]
MWAAARAKSRPRRGFADPVHCRLSRSSGLLAGVRRGEGSAALWAFSWVRVQGRMLSTAGLCYILLVPRRQRRHRPPITDCARLAAPAAAAARGPCVPLLPLTPVSMNPWNQRGVPWMAPDHAAARRGGAELTAPVSFVSGRMHAVRFACAVASGVEAICHRGAVAGA